MSDIQENPSFKSSLQSPGNSLLSGLFLFFLGFFSGITVISILLGLIPGWFDTFNDFLSGRRFDANACMIYRWVQGIYSLISLAMPVLIWAGIHGRPLHHLKLDKSPSVSIAILAGLTIIVSLPAVQFLVIPSDALFLPDWLKSQGQVTSSAVIHLLGDNSAKGFLSNLFFIALIPALTEELLFRGFLQQALGRLMRPQFAILIAAAVFSLMHFELLMFFTRFALGILLGCFFQWSGKLWMSVVAHFAFNGFSVVMAFLATSGKLDPEIMNDDYKFTMWITLISVILTAGFIYIFRKMTSNNNEFNQPAEI